MKKLLTFLFLFLLVVAVVVPHTSHAFQLIPCDGGKGNECELTHLIKLAQNIIDFIIVLAIPFLMIILTYVGVLLVTSQGSVTKKQEAKNIVTKAVIGLAFILTAWLIISTINGYFFKEGYIHFFN